MLSLDIDECGMSDCGSDEMSDTSTEPDTNMVECATPPSSTYSPDNTNPQTWDLAKGINDCASFQFPPPTYVSERRAGVDLGYGGINSSNPFCLQRLNPISEDSSQPTTMIPPNPNLRTLPFYVTGPGPTSLARSFSAPLLSSNHPSKPRNTSPPFRLEDSTIPFVTSENQCLPARLIPSPTMSLGTHSTVMDSYRDGIGEQDFQGYLNVADFHGCLGMVEASAYLSRGDVYQPLSSGC